MNQYGVTKPIIAPGRITRTAEQQQTSNDAAPNMTKWKISEIFLLETG
jgi:hypothetical protein